MHHGRLDHECQVKSGKSTADAKSRHFTHSHPATAEAASPSYRIVVTQFLLHLLLLHDCTLLFFEKRLGEQSSKKKMIITLNVWWMAGGRGMIQLR